jgi:hypothetical protein
MENKRKHLELIQGVINRLAGNLFFVKGWTITLIAGLFALGAKDSNSIYVLIAYFPLGIFWVLDGYFLSKERQFRALYEEVAARDEKEVDFSMDTRRFQKEERNRWLSSVFSATLMCFYVPLIAMLMVIMHFINYG